VSLAAAYTTVPEEMSNSKTEMDENKEDFESFKAFTEVMIQVEVCFATPCSSACLHPECGGSNTRHHNPEYVDFKKDFTLTQRCLYLMTQFLTSFKKLCICMEALGRCSELDGRKDQLYTHSMEW
jgi:hypothetical protein